METVEQFNNRTFCCRCGSEIFDINNIWEIDSTEADIKDIDCGEGYSTSVTAAGQRILVCPKCVTFAERRKAERGE